MAFDFKKEYKEFYMPKNHPEIVTVPAANYMAVRGAGDPNAEGGAYQQAISVLYAVAYTLKMSYKTGYKMAGFLNTLCLRWRDSGTRRMWTAWTTPASPGFTGSLSSACLIL